MPDTNRPDPSLGVFETLLVVRGRPVEQEAHLARLAASLRGLFAAQLPEEAHNLLLRRGAGLELGRLRLMAVPQRDGDIGLEAHGSEVDPATVFPAFERVIALHSFAAPGGLGAHKWADRTYIERAEAAAPADSIALLTDRDDTALEVSRANVFAVLDGTVVTPPADGRILPGTARAAAIETLRASGVEVREAPLPLAGLAAAEEAFLTSSVRGVEPLGSLDGKLLQPPGRITDLLVRRIRRRWLGRPG